MASKGTAWRATRGVGEGALRAEVRACRIVAGNCEIAGNHNVPTCGRSGTSQSQVASSILRIDRRTFDRAGESKHVNKGLRDAGGSSPHLTYGRGRRTTANITWPIKVECQSQLRIVTLRLNDEHTRRAIQQHLRIG